MKKYRPSLRPLFIVLALISASQAKATCVASQSPQFTPTSAIPPIYAPARAPLWNASQSYSANATAQYNGFDYQARWWTSGNMPGGATGEVWKILPDSNGTPRPWQSSQVYYAGEKVYYAGAVFTAKWWTKGSVPTAVGSDWQGGRAPFVNASVTGSGSYSFCDNTSAHQHWTATYQWALSADPDKDFAYWKTLDHDGNEMARGSAVSGTVTTDYWMDVVWTGSTTGYLTVWNYQSYRDLYLCTVSNLCTLVSVRWNNLQ